MMRKVKIEDAGDTDFLPGSIVEKHEFYVANEKVKEKAEAEGKEPNYATCVQQSRSFRLLPSRRQREFLPTLQSRARPIRFSDLKRTLLSVSFFRQVQV